MFLKSSEISPSGLINPHWPSGIAGWPFLLLTGTTNYTLHGKNIVHMTQGSNALHFFYDASNKPAIVDFNGTKYAYVHNLQGDIVAILDSNGSVVVQYKYDAWGRIISKTGSMASTLGTLNPFRYRGYVFDEETGLYYLKSRFYTPVKFRFLNADSLIKNNLFKYCANNPISYVDYAGSEERPLHDFTDILNQDLKDKEATCLLQWPLIIRAINSSLH